MEMYAVMDSLVKIKQSISRNTTTTFMHRSGRVVIWDCFAAAEPVQFAAIRYFVHWNTLRVKKKEKKNEAICPKAKARIWPYNGTMLPSTQDNQHQNG